MYSDQILLEVKNLKKYFPVRDSSLISKKTNVKAVENINLAINKGETLGLVGESGCGKTTAGRAILRLIEPTEGEIHFKSKSLSKTKNQLKDIDVASISSRDLKILRKDMQIIFQDPYSSLNPRMSVGDIIGEPLLIHGMKKKSDREVRISALLESVGLKPDHMKRYPHEFSGGQRQRIGIARSLILGPQFIVADEPVSALDVSIQAQVINLLKELREDFGLTYLFISHDLSVVKHISDRTAVMYLGQIVELAETEELFSSPKHPYTEALMSAIPIPNPDYNEPSIILQGDVPSPMKPPSGCHFHPRCIYAKNICRMEAPDYRELNNEHYVSCHFGDSLTLRALRNNGD